GMIPGMNKAMRGVSFDDVQAEGQLKRIEAIILSMTPQERRDPRILNGSRKRRVASGSGTTVQEVNQLLSQYRQMKKLMSQLQKGKMRGFPRLF
ncbi:MAG: signal recognition particle protein, partial [Anaerolineae bacterium]|nr:signal recognition particle protein [Anaerolineae bacterium]